MYRLLKRNEAKEYYSLYYPKILSYWQKHGHEPRPLILSKLRVEDKKVLDIGCGNGLMLKDLVRKNEVYGIDISSDLLKQAEKIGIKISLFDFDRNGDFPFLEEYFDAILIFEALEHSFNPYLLLKKSIQVLKTGGVIYVTLPNITYPDRVKIIQKSLKNALENVYKGKVPPNAKRFPDINILTLEQLRDLTQRLGLEIAETNGWSWKWEELETSEREYLWKNAKKAEDLLLTLRKSRKN